MKNKSGLITSGDTNEATDPTKIISIPGGTQMVTNSTIRFLFTIEMSKIKPSKTFNTFLIM